MQFTYRYDFINTYQQSIGNHSRIMIKTIDYQRMVHLSTYYLRLITMILNDLMDFRR